MLHVAPVLSPVLSTVAGPAESHKFRSDWPAFVEFILVGILLGVRMRHLSALQHKRQPIIVWLSNARLHPLPKACFLLAAARRSTCSCPRRSVEIFQAYRGL